MARPSHREKILEAGLKVVHKRGFAGASVRDIVQAAGVPQGSFTNHFASKEAFGLEILDIYFERVRQVVDETLRNHDLAPLDGVRAYIDAVACARSADGVRIGCLLGNLSLEVSEHSEPIRLRLAEMFAETEQALAACLRAAVARGDLPPDLDCQANATLIESALQGAILLAKTQRSPEPLGRLQTLFPTVLFRPAA